ncbi:MAG: flagellin [Thermoguttaceae bacterium]
MTRIMTNVPSLTGQKFLNRNMASLQQSLTRLSTGLKINSGADDPAGLISSEILRSEITGIKTAIKNTERANGMIATADSALNEVSKLLNDIRGLVTEAANTGGMSNDMIAANQLQVNASLDAIDRIAASTSFMGGNLLDGTLDFQTRGIDRKGLQAMNVRQVAFPDNGKPIDVAVDVVAKAEQAKLYYNAAATADKINLSWGGNRGFQMQPFEKGTSVQQIADVINKMTNSTGVVAEVGSDAMAGRIYVSNVGAGNDMIIESGTKGANAGCVDVKFLEGTSEGIRVEYVESPGAGEPAKVYVYLQTEAWKSAQAGCGSITTGYSNGTTKDTALDFTAVIQGAQYNNTKINIVDGLLTYAGFNDPAINESTVANGVVSKYFDTAVAAKAVIGDVNGLNPFKDAGGVDLAGYVTLEAKQPGAQFNNTKIQFVATTAQSILKDRNAVAQYDAASSTYTVYVDQTRTNAGAVTFDDIQKAVKDEGTFSLSFGGAMMATSVFGIANTVVGLGNVIGNTNNSGGDAGTLFVYAATAGSAGQYLGATMPQMLPTAFVKATPPAGPGTLEVNNFPRTTAIDKFSLTLVDGGPSGPRPPVVKFDPATGELKVSVRSDNGVGTNTPTTYAELETALAQFQDPSIGIGQNTFVLNTGAVGTIAAGHMSKSGFSWGDAGIPVAWGTVAVPGAFRIVPTTADQIRKTFDLNDPASHGSETAAALFNVALSIDNNGSGYVFSQTFTGDKAMNGGVTGGKVISTGNDVVTALNNSLYWNSVMCPELLDRLYRDNAGGVFYDRTSPPPVVTRLAAGQHGLTAVSAFSEVAYYGSPYDGTGLQFLGGTNSPNIRFVKGLPGSSLSIDTTTLAPKVDYAQAVLSGVNPNSSLVVTAKKKGGEYDNVQFVFRQAPTVMNYAVKPPVPAVPLSPAEGWVEYDGGSTFAAAQCMLTDNRTGVVPMEPTFILTANDRGDINNNVAIRMNTNKTQDEPVLVKFNKITNTVDITLGMLSIDSICLQDVINAVNDAGIGYTATPSFARNAQMDTLTELFGAVTVGPPLVKSALFGLNDEFTTIGNTGDSGGHKGQVTVWMAAGEDVNAAVRHITRDNFVGSIFNAQTYTPVTSGVGGNAGFINYVSNDRIVTQGGQLDPGTIIVNLATDKSGNPSTTAKQFSTWWQTLPENVRSGISVSVLRQPGENLDNICDDDTAGQGILQPTFALDECDKEINRDISFVGWYDDCEKPYAFKADFAKGTMTSQAGAAASYTLIARKPGPAYNDYSIRYINDDTLTGKFADNVPAGKLDECGNMVYPAYMLKDGLYLELNEKTKEITIYMKNTVTTASDIKQLIENDPHTKSIFKVDLTDGKGTGAVLLSDDTLKTVNGSYPPGYYDGAKLLFGADAANYNLMFRSEGYGSDQFVDVQGLILNGTGSVFTLKDAKGAVTERGYGEDVIARINGAKATAHGQNVSLNTPSLSLTFTVGDHVESGDSMNFQILGGGATFQIGPRVVTSQQISIAFRNLNTVNLGGASGRLYELREGNDADLFTDTFRGYRIIEEAIVDITTMRGALGSLQKTTLDTNINVLNDTLEAIMTAESVVRDTDFAEETANMTRAQVLAQANIQALGIANQLPNYVLRLLGG